MISRTEIFRVPVTLFFAMISVMYEKIIRALKAMELEEKVLHIGVLICVLGILMPWVGVQLYGNIQQWGGFGYHTGYIGQGVFVAQLYIVAVTLLPLAGGPVLLRKSRRNLVRLYISSLCTCLIFAAFTILLRLTFEVSGAEVRFGVYVALIGSVITTLYAFLRYQEDLQNQGQAIFHHPDESASIPAQKNANHDIVSPEVLPPPPPPPAPHPPEDHHLYQS